MEKRRAALFVGFVYGLAAICALPLFFLNGVVDAQAFQGIFMGIGMVFMWLPVLAVWMTRKITNDPFRVALRPHVKRDWPVYVSACFLPGLAICVGTAFFFLLFPNQLDLTWGFGQAVLGAAPPFSLSLPMVIGAGLLLTLLAPLVLLNHLLAFGEEYGWRGYLLRKLQTFWPDWAAVLVSGGLWGLVHAPLVYFGLNYNTGYPGAPWTGMLMMVVFAIVLGIWFSYLTIRTHSVVAASIAHGALNAAREAPLFIAVLGVNTLLGPKPSGIIGMAGLLIVAVVCVKGWGRLK